MKLVYTYQDGSVFEIVIKKPLTRALAEMYRIKYSSPFHDRGVVHSGKEKISLDDYIKEQAEKERYKKLGVGRKAIVNDIDKTVLVDRGLSKTWKCPHCEKINHFGDEAEDILIGFGKYIEQCPQCGYLHIWELRLTDDFKRKTIDMLKEGAK